MQNLSQYKGQYTPESQVLDAKGLLTAQPYEDDFSPITYPCLVCGKPVGLENGYLSQDVKVLGRIRPYHIHSACEANASAYYSKLGNTYRHKATKRTVPTWTQLTQSQEANPREQRLNGRLLRQPPKTASLLLMGKMQPPSSRKRNPLGPLYLPFKRLLSRLRQNVWSADRKWRTVLFTPIPWAAPCINTRCVRTASLSVSTKRMRIA